MFNCFYSMGARAYAYRKRAWNVNTLERNKVGDLSELKAAAWLMEQGYEVFRNVGCTGPADLVAWDQHTGETRFIDVKTASPGINQNGSTYLGYPRHAHHNKVEVLVYLRDGDRFFWHAPGRRGRPPQNR